MSPPAMARRFFCRLSSSASTRGRTTTIFSKSCSPSRRAISSSAASSSSSSGRRRNSTICGRSSTAPAEYHDHDHGHEGHHEQAARHRADAIFSAVSQQTAGAGYFLHRRERAGRSAHHARIPRHRRRLQRDARAHAGAAPGNRSICRPAKRCWNSWFVSVSASADGIKVPKKQAAVAREIRAMMQLVAGKTATVEDAAEATLRIYARLARVKNDYLG